MKKRCFLLAFMIFIGATCGLWADSLSVYSSAGDSLSFSSYYETGIGYELSRQGWGLGLGLGLRSLGTTTFSSTGETLDRDSYECLSPHLDLSRSLFTIGAFKAVLTDSTRYTFGLDSVDGLEGLSAAGGGGSDLSYGIFENDLGLGLGFAFGKGWSLVARVTLNLATYVPGASAPGFLDGRSGGLVLSYAF